MLNHCDYRIWISYTYVCILCVIIVIGIELRGNNATQNGADRYNRESDHRYSQRISQMMSRMTPTPLLLS